MFKAMISSRNNLNSKIVQSNYTNFPVIARKQKIWIFAKYRNVVD